MYFFFNFHVLIFKSIFHYYKIIKKYGAIHKGQSHFNGKKFYKKNIKTNYKKDTF